MTDIKIIKYGTFSAGVDVQFKCPNCGCIFVINSAKIRDYESRSKADLTAFCPEARCGGRAVIDTEPSKSV